ncbi:tetratricopeptide repeat protein [Smaragdicoccus niigatensis]|uniref:tetratricopeptide repeat protein n=1 Tax=Smaragdicoccus niigatensis TaxID=359359 RepID=UPI00036699BE
MAAAMSGAVDLSALKRPAKTAEAPASTSAFSVDVTEENFEVEVLNRSIQIPVVVALYSTRSPASVQLVQIFDTLVAEGNGTWQLARVDVDANMRIAQVFGIQSIPTTVAVAGGRPLADLPGVQSETQVRKWIEALLQATAGKLEGGEGALEDDMPADPRFVAAENLLDSGDLAGAQAAYEKILQSEPHNGEAKAALRQVGLLQRAESLTPDDYVHANANPDDVEAQLKAADIEMLRQEPEAAFQRLIDAVRRFADDDRTAVRTRLLELFELFDPAEPIVKAARRRLATALY